jgi:hypothetical protein
MKRRRVTRHLRAETGFGVNDLVLKCDGEPFEPRHVVEQVQAILGGLPRSLDVTLDEAREIAYHYIRAHLADKARPAKIEQKEGDSERLWVVGVVGRDSGEMEGELRIGAETGSIYSWELTKVMSAGASSD